MGPPRCALITVHLDLSPPSDCDRRHDRRVATPAERSDSDLRLDAHAPLAEPAIDALFRSRLSSCSHDVLQLARSRRPHSASTATAERRRRVRPSQSPELREPHDSRIDQPPALPNSVLASESRQRAPAHPTADHDRVAQETARGRRTLRGRARRARSRLEAPRQISGLALAIGPTEQGAPTGRAGLTDRVAVVARELRVVRVVHLSPSTNPRTELRPVQAPDDRRETRTRRRRCRQPPRVGEDEARTRCVWPTASADFHFFFFLVSGKLKPFHW